MDGITDSMDMSWTKLQEMVKDGEPGMLQSMGSQRVGCDLTKANKILGLWWVMFLAAVRQ